MIRPLPVPSALHRGWRAFTAGLPLVHTAANTTLATASRAATKPTQPPSAMPSAHADAFCNREDYDEAYENPLPKLYHEKREREREGKISIPKKRDKRKASHPRENALSPEKGIKILGGQMTQKKANLPW